MNRPESLFSKASQGRMSILGIQEILERLQRLQGFALLFRRHHDVADLDQRRAPPRDVAATGGLERD